MEGLPSLAGPVSTIRSDNGKNFVVTNQEQKESPAGLNHENIQRALVQDGIKLSFNRLETSHYGGVWESLIHSVKSVLTSVHFCVLIFGLFLIFLWVCI